MVLFCFEKEIRERLKKDKQNHCEYYNICYYSNI